MSSEDGVPVDLYVYDLTKGLANLLSYSLLGRQIEGVWHTAIVVFDAEFFYGGHGISSCSPGGTALGEPLKVERLGNTFVPHQVFLDYIEGLATTTYAGSKYNLLEHNCNHFSDEVAQFLCGVSVPKHIVQQPEHALSPAQLQSIRALLDTVAPNGQSVYVNGARHSRRDSPEFLTLNTQIEEARSRPHLSAGEMLRLATRGAAFLFALRRRTPARPPYFPHNQHRF